MSSFETELYSRYKVQREYLGVEKGINKIEPMVSVSVPTYQHVGYIQRCLDAILSQVVSFPFEIIIGEDGSTDGTAEICKNYAELNQDKIRLFLRDRCLSQYIKEDGSVSRFNGHWNRMSARGKYIAICEGDDYWTDPYKLQKQVNFLEANPDYSMCFHNAIEHWEDGSREDQLFSKVEDKDYDAVGLTEYWTVPTASILMRRSVLDSDLYKEVIRRDFLFGDTPLILTCASLGKVRGMSDVMSVYRRQKNGASQSFDINKYHALIQHQLSMADLFGASMPEVEHNGVVTTCLDGFVYSVKTGHPDFSFLRIAYKYDSHAIWKSLIERFKIRYRTDGR